MAHLHFRQTTYKSGGTAATGRVAYITRQPVHDLSRGEQQLRYIQEGREDLVYTQSRNLPPWADTPHTYFQAAERHEGKNRVAFTELKISLPVELTRRQNMGLMHDLVDAITGDTLPCTYAFHAPRTLTDSSQQPHLHLLISARRTDQYARTPAQHFTRYNRAHPERGGAEKDPASWHMGAVKAQRHMVADVINLHLEMAEVAAWVDPRTLEDRDIPREAEPKLLPSESRAYREEGIISERMQQVLTIRAERAPQMQREQEHARVYWQHRKIELGIHHAMPMAERLERIRESRAHAIDHAPERPTLAQMREQTQTLERSVTSLERYVQRVERTQRQEHRLEQSHGPYEWRQMRDAEKVLADGVQHGLPRDVEAERLVAQLSRYLAAQEQEPQAGAALNVRLFREEERERDQGMGF